MFGLDTGSLAVMAPFLMVLGIVGIGAWRRMRTKELDHELELAEIEARKLEAKVELARIGANREPRALPESESDKLEKEIESLR